MGTLIEQRHRDRLEIVLSLDPRWIENIVLHAVRQDGHDDVADGAAAAADIGDARRVEPADFPVGDQRLDTQPAMPHDIDADEGRKLRTCIGASPRHGLLAQPLQLALGGGDDVVQQFVLGLEMIVEGALREPAGLHDVAHRDDRITTLCELGEGRGADGLDRRPRVAFHGLRRPVAGADGLALAHRDAPAMLATIDQARSAAGFTSLPDSAARTFDAVPSSDRA